MSSVAQEPTDVILRDGSTLRLRAPLAEDTDAMLDFFERLSPESRYLRFHGFAAVGPKLVEPLVDPDWFERGALVGYLEGRIVALANYVRLREPREAEAAFTVDDDYQRRGIGTRLLQTAEQAARHASLDGLVVKAQRGAESFFIANGFVALPVDDAARDYPHRLWKPVGG